MLAIIGRSSENFAGTSRNSKESRIEARNSEKRSVRLESPTFFFGEYGTPVELPRLFSKEAAALDVPVTRPRRLRAPPRSLRRLTVDAAELARGTGPAPLWLRVFGNIHLPE